MLPLIIRRKLSFSTSFESSSLGGKNNRTFYGGVMEQVKSALAVDLQESGNACCAVDPRSPSPDGKHGTGAGSHSVASGLSTSFAAFLFRPTRFSGKKIEQGESALEASGTSSAKDASKSKKRNKKRSTAASPGASKTTTPVEEPPLTFSMIPVEVLKTWESSFSSLLADQHGEKLFESFLKTEFSEENLLFYKACEIFKELPDHLLPEKATQMIKEYIDPQAAKLVNIDHHTSKAIKDLRSTPTRTMFNEAQQSIYLLMARDSFARFIKSESFQTALRRE